MSQITRILRGLLLTAAAFGVGLFVGGVFSYLLVSLVALALGPKFWEWEGAGGITIVVGALVGGLTAMICTAVCYLPFLDATSLRKKALIGLCLGVVPWLALALVVFPTSVGDINSSRPRGLDFCFVVILACAGGVTGAIGSLIADAPKWRFSLHSLLIFVTCFALLSGLLADGERLRMPQRNVQRQVEAVINPRVINRRHIVAGVSGGLLVALGHVLDKSASSSKVNKLKRIRYETPDRLARQAQW